MPGVPFTANRWTSTTRHVVRQCLLGLLLMVQTPSIDVPAPFLEVADLLHNSTPLARTHREGRRTMAVWRRKMPLSGSRARSAIVR